ncbi:MAG TPA: GNAT family N-acetyltransferase [Paenibacillus sp.]|uniref:GNAT family N-acetyltransferase n=1 Tax=Paenibacillus sp. TaxID=58172 RepID=UPI0028D3F1EA|nr:GNAT family N-acetyltransferase [Paenibacillus sp.]HUC92909.1 GNAT family N-acetyltransferase [Paenibacillus sp.]
MRETVKQGDGCVVKQDGEIVAEITYVPQGEDTLVIDHTYVDPSMRGQKLAEELVRQVVEEARATNKKIVPACSYAYALFMRKKEYGDVWRQ